MHFGQDFRVATQGPNVASLVAGLRIGGAEYQGEGVVGIVAANFQHVLSSSSEDSAKTQIVTNSICLGMNGVNDHSHTTAL